MSSTDSRKLLAVAQIVPAGVYYCILFLGPMILLGAYSFYAVRDFQFVSDWNLGNFKEALTSDVFRQYYLRTLRLSSIVAVLVVLLAFPFAYILTFRMRSRRQTVYFLVLVALFGGYLVRIYAWRTILGARGVINETLQWLHLIDEPLTWISNSQFAIVLALTNYLLPLGVLPIFTAMQSLSPRLIEAAADLGASQFRIAATVVAPLCVRGVLAALVFSFIGAAADWLTPQLLGGTGDQMIGNQIANMFGGGFDWPLGAALAIVLVLGVSLVFALPVLAARAFRRVRR